MDGSTKDKYNNRNSYFINIAALGGYSLLAVVLTFPMILHLNAYYVFSDPGYLDLFIQLWNSWWFKKAIINLNTSPFFSEYIFHPVGESIVFQAVSPVYAFLSIPLQLIFGKKGIFLGYNICLLFSFIFCGWGTYLLANYLIKNSWAAFIAGTLFTLCGIRLFNLSRLNILCMEFIPFSLLYLLKTIDQKNRKNVFALSFFLALNFYNSFTHFLNVVLAGGCFLLSQLFLKKNALISGSLLKRFSLVIVLFLLLTGPFIYIIAKDVFSENPYLHRGIEEAIEYSLDLAVLFIPTGFDSIYGGFFENIHFGKWDYTFSYFLGFTWIFLIIIGFLRVEKKKTFMLWFSGIVLFLLSLGPVLKVFGMSTGIPLPSYLLYTYIPLFQICGVPYRVVTVVYLCLSIIAGFGVAALLSQRYFFFGQILQPKKIIITLLFALIMLESIDTYPVVNKNSTENFQLSFYDQMSKDNQTYAILDLPIEEGLDRIYMFYQIFHEKKICSAALRRSPLSSYSFLNIIPLFSRIRQQEYSKIKANHISSDEVFTNRKKLRDNNIKFVILHNKYGGSAPTKYANKIKRYQNIIEQFQPVKKIPLGWNTAYRFW